MRASLLGVTRISLRTVMLVYLITVLYIWGIMVNGTYEVCRSTTVTYEKDDILYGRQVVQTPNTTNAVVSAMECSVFCERNPDCIYFRNAEQQCSTFTSFVTPSTSLPGAVYYIKAGANPCERFPTFLYLPSPRLCIRLSPLPRYHSVSTEYCSADGARLLVLDNDEKYNHVITYLNSLGVAAYHPGWNYYVIWVGMTNSTDGVFEWITGSTFVPRWKPGAPIGNGNCITLNANGLVDIICRQFRRFLCEISMDS